MKDDHSWIYEYDHLNINNHKLYFRCVWSMGKKAPNEKRPAVQLVLVIWDDTDKVWIDWDNFKGSYYAEKITDYIQNTLNGQRTVYWDNKRPRTFKEQL